MHCIANKVNAWECARWQVRNAPKRWEVEAIVDTVGTL